MQTCGLGYRSRVRGYELNGADDALSVPLCDRCIDAVTGNGRAARRIQRNIYGYFAEELAAQDARVSAATGHNIDALTTPWIVESMGGAE